MLNIRVTLDEYNQELSVPRNATCVCAPPARSPRRRPAGAPPPPPPPPRVAVCILPLPFSHTLSLHTQGSRGS